MLTKDEIKHYRVILEDEKKKLMAEITRDSKPEDFGSDNDHFEEAASEAESFGNELGIIQALKERVSEIDMALNRMETGEYGLCINCSREIPKRMLDLVPESELCIECKKV